MTANPPLARPRIATTVLAIALAKLIGIGLLAAVASLFQRAGTPLEQLRVAERACAGYAFVSERQDCMQAYLVASRAQTVASR